MKAQLYLYKYFAKHIKDLERGCSVEELWDQAVDHLGVEGSIAVRKGVAKIVYTVGGIEHECTRPANEVLVYKGSDLKEEKYELLLNDALSHIVQDKMLDKKKKRG